MSEARTVLVAAFRGPVSCAPVDSAPCFTLTGTTPGGEPLSITFGAPAPADLPTSLESACVEREEGGAHCIRAAGRAWRLATCTLHLHHGVPSFYGVIAPRVPAWHRRLVLSLLVKLAASPTGFALLRRLRRQSGSS
jgi:hypothetical protein